MCGFLELYKMYQSVHSNDNVMDIICQNQSRFSNISAFDTFGYVLFDVLIKRFAEMK